jgi:hypothetical protein
MFRMNPNIEIEMVDNHIAFGTTLAASIASSARWAIEEISVTFLQSCPATHQQGVSNVNKKTRP